MVKRYEAKLRLRLSFVSYPKKSAQLSIVANIDKDIPAGTIYLKETNSSGIFHDLENITLTVVDGQTKVLGPLKILIFVFIN